MASSSWTCDGVSTAVMGSSFSANHVVSNELKPPPSSSNHNPMPLTTSASEPVSKRGRFSFNHTSVIGLANGFTELSGKSSLSGSAAAAGATEIGLSNEFRVNFTLHFKGILKEKLASYLTRLDKAEESINAMRNELTELTGRMNAIDNSSQDLKKFVTERVSLPAPTSGVGQRRTLSSQAPRLPPPPQMVSALEPTVSTSIHSLLASVTKLTTAVTTTLHDMTGRSVLTNSTSLNNSVSAPLLRTTSVCNASSTPAIQKPFKPLTTVTVAPVRIPDTIDLTLEPSIISNPIPAPNLGRAGIDHLKPSNINAVIPRQTTAIPQNLSGIPNVRSQPAVTQTICSVLTQSLVSPKSSHSALRTLNRTPVPQGTLRTTQPPSFVTSTRPTPSVLDLNPLPVAPLPPLPYQPQYGGLAIQPIPLLTIAEAAEGVCLQWTISQQLSSFEPATAYEIYSYASSELTSSNVYTHLPWKKVGEVSALPLPMACTLTHVQSNNLYYFAVRSVDRFRRYSHWSNVVNAVVS